MLLVLTWHLDFSQSLNVIASLCLFSKLMIVVLNNFHLWYREVMNLSLLLNCCQTFILLQLTLPDVTILSLVLLAYVF